MPSKLSFILAMLLLANHAFSQSDLSGTWYINGRKNSPATIFQSGNTLHFYAGSQTSSGQFNTANEIYAKDWKNKGTFSEKNANIIWDNQIWTRTAFSEFPVVSGTWFLSNNPAEIYSIIQDNMYFTIDAKGDKIGGYFSGNNKITVPSWKNAIASITDDGKSIKWDNQTWINGKPPVTNSSTSQNRWCRYEISIFYMAVQSLGNVWGTVGAETNLLNMEAVTEIDANLTYLENTMNSLKCIEYDFEKIHKFKSHLSGTPSSILKTEIEQIIKDLQSIVLNLKMNCDKGVSTSALFTSAIHLGSALAWAESRNCLPTPISSNIQNVISNHLTTANTALLPYATCIPNLDFNLFGKVNLGSSNAIALSSMITEIQQKLIWSLALSECCCECSPNSLSQVTSDCDSECKRYCQSIGKSNGKFNGKLNCVSGVVSGGSQNGCDCW